MGEDNRSMIDHIVDDDFFNSDPTSRAKGGGWLAACRGVQQKIYLPPLMHIWPAVYPLQLL
jgi:hypothetical protein